MKKGNCCILAAAMFGMLTATPTIGAEGESKKPAPAALSKAKKAVRHAFHGKLSAVDKSAMTITVEAKGKTSALHVTSHTRITKAGKPATFGDAAVGEEVDGQAIKNAAGEEEAVTVRLASKSAEKPRAKKAKKPAGEKK